MMQFILPGMFLEQGMSLNNRELLQQMDYLASNGFFSATSIKTILFVSMPGTPNQFRFIHRMQRYLPIIPNLHIRLKKKMVTLFCLL